MERRRGARYTREFREETVALIRSSHKSVAEICRELGLTQSTVQRWLERPASTPPPSLTGRLTPTERDELSELRREVRVLREEREILRKAAAFFAQETTR